MTNATFKTKKVALLMFLAALSFFSSGCITDGVETAEQLYVVSKNFCCSRIAITLPTDESSDFIIGRKPFPRTIDLDNPALSDEPHYTQIARRFWDTRSGAFNFFRETVSMDFGVHGLSEHETSQSARSVALSVLPVNQTQSLGNTKIIKSGICESNELRVVYVEFLQSLAKGYSLYSENYSFFFWLSPSHYARITFEILDEVKEDTPEWRKHTNDRIKRIIESLKVTGEALKLTNSLNTDGLPDKLKRCGSVFLN